MDKVELVTMIKTTNARRGDGSKEPIRVLTQYWDMDGKMIFEIDPFYGDLRSPKKSGRKPKDDF